MLVTSTPEVLVPGMDELIPMLLHDGLDPTQLLRIDSGVFSQQNMRFQPEFRFTVPTNHMHVKPDFFP